MLPRKNLAETASEAGTFGTLLAAAKAAGLVDALTKGGPFTVFARRTTPSRSCPPERSSRCSRDTAKLKAILTYHVVPGRVLSTDLKLGTTAAETVNGRKLNVSRSKGRRRSREHGPGHRRGHPRRNGVIHVVDSVILPR